MRIRSFSVQGYRSLLDVTLDDLGPINVFYGENGAGKSNLLQAMTLAVRTIEHLATYNAHELIPGPVPAEHLASASDFHPHTSTIRLLLHLTGVDRPAFRYLAWSADEVLLSVCLERPGGPVVASFDSLRLRRTGSPSDLELVPAPGLSAEEQWGRELTAAGWRGDAPNYRTFRTHLQRFLAEVVGAQTWRIVPAIRTLDPLVPASSPPHRASESAAVDALLRRGRIVEAMFLAHTSSDPKLRRGFEQLRDMLTAPPLSRPRFDPVLDRATDTYALQEVRDLDVGPVGMPVANEGLGIQNIYVILGFLILGQSFAVAVEEPEAHLHAPTTGRHLRELLTSAIDKGYVKQLFIATHSSQFALDLDGYYDVRLDDERATRVERRADLVDLDRRHVEEPGATLRALLVSLRDVGDLDAAEPIAFRPDGSPVSVHEMILGLQTHDAAAMEFLDAVTAAAVRSVVLAARRRARA